MAEGVTPIEAANRGAITGKTATPMTEATWATVVATRTAITVERGTAEASIITVRAPARTSPHCLQTF